MPKVERFSYERLSKTLGPAKGTVMKLIDAPEKAGLVQRIPPCGSLSKAKLKSPKIKFTAVPIKSALLFGSGFSLGKKEVLASLLAICSSSQQGKLLPFRLPLTNPRRERRCLNKRKIRADASGRRRNGPRRTVFTTRRKKFVRKRFILCRPNCIW